MAYKKTENRLEKYKTEVKGKVPPNNIEAEQSLLGSVLLNHEMFDLVASVIDTPDFYEPRHQLIYDAMKTLNQGGSAVDSVTVIDLLKTRGQIDACGGVSYVSSLADSIPTYAHARDYADIVRNKAILRNMINMSTEIVEASYREEMTAQEILESADDMLVKVTERKQQDSFEEVSELVDGVYEKIIQRTKDPNAFQGLQTGYRKIDDYTAGLKPGELIIIAARPSLGKTSLALNIAYRLGVNEQKNILIFSFEMSSQDLMSRFFAVGSRVDLQKIRMGRLDSDDKAKLMHVAGQLSETRIFIDTSDNGVFDMRAKTRTKMSELKKQNKTLDLVIIDYMQLVKPNESIPREQQISQISRSLKTIARELKVPVIALSQLNREVEKREKAQDRSSPPRLSDLRESGAIEQDADVVIFIHREGKEEATMTETYESNASMQRKALKCKLIISKNRNGPVGEQGVWFIPELTVFQEMSSMDSDEAGYESNI